MVDIVEKKNLLKNLNTYRNSSYTPYTVETKKLKKKILEMQQETLESTNNLQYVINSDEKTLQILLEVNTSLIISSSTICWMSDQLTIEKIDSFFSFLFNTKTNNLRVINLSLPIKYIGLGQKTNGKIFVMKRTNNNCGLYFFKDIFLCSYNINEIITRPFPDYSK